MVFMLGIWLWMANPALVVGAKASVLPPIYRAELGVREATGKNDGDRVETYLRYVGLTKGQPWCAAFVCWVLGEAKINNPRSGWSPAVMAGAPVVWRKQRGIGNGKKESILPGDVFGIFFPEKGRVAHVGFIEEWKTPWVVTVEGNTNAGGAREGEGVYRRRRLCASLHAIVRYGEKGVSRD